MENWNTELSLERPFGPWLLKAKLPEDVLDKMIEITDKITDDTQNISLGHGLAGIIEDEPFVPNEILKSEVSNYFYNNPITEKDSLSWAKETIWFGRFTQKYKTRPENLNEGKVIMNLSQTN